MIGGGGVRVWEEVTGRLVPGLTKGKGNGPANARDARDGFDPWSGRSPWSRKWQCALEFLPEESPWTEEPGGLQFMGSQRVDHD